MPIRGNRRGGVGGAGRNQRSGRGNATTGRGNATTGRGNATTGRGNGPSQRMAKYSGHSHYVTGTSQWPSGSSDTGSMHTHTSLTESPLHFGSSGHIHPSSFDGNPGHTHNMIQGQPHSDLMGIHDSGPVQGASQGPAHSHVRPSGTFGSQGRHIHQKGPRPPQPRSGTGGRGRRRRGRRGY